MILREENNQETKNNYFYQKYQEKILQKKLFWMEVIEKKNSEIYDF